MSVGVYIIFCAKSGKFYIGSSKNVERRLYNHFNLLRHNSHHSSKLQEAYNTYGANSFASRLLKECSVKDLRGCERWYIFNHRPEYNMRIPIKL